MADQLAPPTHLITHDEERIEHIISDEQLMQLASGGNDISLQVSVGALGVAVGTFQNIVNVTGAIQDGLPINGLQASAAGLFLVAATAFVIAALYYRRTSASVGKLTDKIRDRKVYRMADRPYEGGKPFPGDPDIPTDVSSTTE